MDIAEIKAKVRDNQYFYSHHAEVERRAEELTFAQVEEALLSSEVLEQYPEMSKIRCNFCGSDRYLVALKR